MKAVKYTQIKEELWEAYVPYRAGYGKTKESALAKLMETYKSEHCNPVSKPGDSKTQEVSTLNGNITT